MGTVINRTTKKLYRSVNTPDYPTDEWIQNPDLSNVNDVSQLYWKLVGDDVVEMDQSEKDAIDEAQSEKVSFGLHQINYELHSEDEYLRGKLVARRTYAKADESSLSVLVEEELFVYTGSSLISSSRTAYSSSDGGIILTESFDYYSDRQSNGIMKVKKVKR